MDAVRGGLAAIGMICIHLPTISGLRPLHPATRQTGPGRSAQRRGVAVAGLNIAVDVLAYHRGWWRYPGVGDRGFGPVIWYVGAAIGVSGVTLIGWRAHRRWGFGGTIVFVLAFALYGAVRDWVVSCVARDVIVFGTGALPWIADYAAWLGVWFFPSRTVPAARRTHRARSRGRHL